MIKAFLLSRQWFDNHNGINLELWFSSDEGPVKVIIENQKAVFFIKQEDTKSVGSALSSLQGIEIKTLDLKNFNQLDMAGVYFNSQQTLYRARDILKQQDIA